MNPIRPTLLIIRDGWGHNPYPEWNEANAVVLGDTPVNDRLLVEYPNVLIHTSGEDVGLPAGVMGNSEVGHQNIGAGRIVDQEVMRITRAIRDGSFFENPVLEQACRHVIETGGSFHILGLVSDGRVHSDMDHAIALVEMAKRHGVPPDRIFVHAITDGRDTPPTSGVDYLGRLQQRLREIGAGRISTIIGRYYAMDRDLRWQRTERAYRLLTRGEGKVATDSLAALREYYEHPSESHLRGDEFVSPTVVAPDGKIDPRQLIRSDDAVVFFNFRGDRTRQLTKAFVLPDEQWRAIEKGGFERGDRLENLFFATMTGYETGLPVHVVFEKPPKMKNILGDYLAQKGLRQFRCAETEKYPHVTFFFNDYREEPFEHEDRCIIPSPRDVSTYDQKPEMSAIPVTDEVVQRIESKAYALIVVNYANGDMVGHTGNLQAAIKAVETVDHCVGRLLETAAEAGMAAIVTADHGNCEQMIDPATGGPHTAHTTYDVDLIVVAEDARGKTLRTGGRLADIAPTLLDLMGLPKPDEMTGRSLLEP